MAVDDDHPAPLDLMLAPPERRQPFPRIESSPQRLLAIVTFLALLELIRIKVVRVFQAEAFGPILVSRAYALVTQDDEMDLESEPVSGSQED